MLSSITNNSSIALLEKLAAFAERRQEVLAGNVANIDTPGYRSRDLPVEQFQQALQQAIESRRTPQSLADLFTQTDRGAKSIDDFFPQELFQAVTASPENITFQDGANRSIEQEMMKMTQNSMMQNFAVELMTAQMNLLQSVISGRP